MHVGSHISIRRGFLEAARTARAIGAGAFQYFPKNPRSLAIKTFSAEDARACADFCKEHDIVSIAHTPYLTNLAAEEPDLRHLTVRSLLNDLDITEACGSIGLVVHFGKYSGKDPLQGYKNIIQLIDAVTAEWNGGAKLLIENQAGEGSFMGTTFEELVKIRGLVRQPDKVGFCFDTCHAFASGLWSGDDWSEVERQGRALGYFDHLLAIHLNDSKYGTGMRKDRHAPIGQGCIGLGPMEQFVRSDAVRGVPLFLETPVPRGGSHKDEIALVKRLARMPG